MNYLFPILLLLLPSGGAQGTHPDPADACAAWKIDRSDTAAQTFSPGRGVLCFTGDISPASAEAFVREMERTAQTGPLVIVVDSLGGNAEAGMTMGEAIFPRDATLIVEGICASSCANYLFIAADRRVVAPRSLLVFHGGVTPLDRDALRASLLGQVPAAQVESTIDDLERQIGQQVERQDALLLDAGVDQNLFRWMATTFSKEDEAGDCRMQEADAVVFSPDVLAEHGIEIHDYKGPVNNAEIADILNDRALDRKICLVSAA